MSSLDEAQLETALALATRAAEVAGGVAMGWFRREDLEVEAKADESPVTVADRQAEAALREVLASDPALGELDVLGEEAGLQGPGTRLRWVVDPIDGTLSFSRGLPLFGCLVALVDTEGEESLVGVSHYPALGRTLQAAKSLGCRLDGAPTQVRAESDLAEAMWSLGDPYWYRTEDLRPRWERVMARAKWARSYTDCFGHLMLLCGGTSLLWDTGYNPWDLAAFRVQVPEAGGALRVRNTPGRAGCDVLAGAPALVDEVAEELGF